MHDKPDYLGLMKKVWMTWNFINLKKFTRLHILILVTLNVNMLNREIFPPDADMRYESFLDKAKQGTASSELVPVRSFVISPKQLLGCHN